jgi:YD repeat-containing protein
MRGFGWTLSVVAIVACSDGASGPERPLLPGAVKLLAPSADALPGGFGFETLPQESGCRTRYEFAGEAQPLDCTTELLGGDPFHWLRRCPDHALLPLETEVAVDAVGRPLTTRVVWDSANAQLTQYSYDGAGRLTGYVIAPTRSETTGLTAVVQGYTAGGQPTRIVLSGSVYQPSAGPYIPGSDQRQNDITYDEHERIVARRMHFTGAGAQVEPFWDEVVVYDDAAGRIDREVDISDHYSDGTTSAGANIGYQLFDEQNHVVAYHWQTPGDPAFDFTYSYDDAGLLLTTTFDNHMAGVAHAQYVAHEIRDCR